MSRLTCAVLNYVQYSKTAPHYASAPPQHASSSSPAAAASAAAVSAMGACAMGACAIGRLRHKRQRGNGGTSGGTSFYTADASGGAIYGAIVMYDYGSVFGAD
jgi:hypothetical protein